MFDAVAPPSDSLKKEKKDKKSSKKTSKKERKSKARGSKASQDSHDSSVFRSQSSSTRRKRTRKGKTSGRVSWLDIEKWVTRGVSCQICNCKDSDTDLVFGNRKMLWGYPPMLQKGAPNTYTTTGRSCFYCTRTHMAA